MAKICVDKKMYWMESCITPLQYIFTDMVQDILVDKKKRTFTTLNINNFIIAFGGLTMRIIPIYSIRIRRITRWCISVTFLYYCYFVILFKLMCVILLLILMM